MANKAVEITLLVHAARGAASNSDSYSLRRRMHIFACRLVNLKRISEDPDEDADPRVRLTSTEASESFQKGIEELWTDKK